jgi:hypothetical protein
MWDFLGVKEHAEYRVMVDSYTTALEFVVVEEGITLVLLFAPQHRI